MSNHLEKAQDKLGLARDQLTVGVADAASSTADAAREVGADLQQRTDDLMEQGREVLTDAERWIRERPVAAFGIAFGVGYLLSRLLRR